LLAAIPILGRALQHRLIFGIELTLALLAGAGCDRWLEGRGRGILFGGAAAAVGLSFAWFRFAGEWREQGVVTTQVGWTIMVATVAGLLAVSLWLSRETRWRLFPLLPALVAIDLLAAHGRINPGLSGARLYPQTPAVSWLREHAIDEPYRVAGFGSALRPNTAVVYGLLELRGDDPVKLAKFEAISEELSGARSLHFLPVRNWASPWLDRLSVRWVVAPPAAPPPDPTWSLAWEGPGARIYERPGAPPLVRWAGEAPAGLVEIVGQSPGRWKLQVLAERPAKLVVAEIAAKGWRVRVDGGRRELAIGEEPLLAVDVQPGAHEVALDYRPPGGALGLAISLLTLAGFGVAARARPRLSPATSPRTLPSSPGGESGGPPATAEL
jgi:hypothetical protein